MINKLNETKDMLNYSKSRETSIFDQDIEPLCKTCFPILVIIGGNLSDLLLLLFI